MKIVIERAVEPFAPDYNWFILEPFQSPNFVTNTRMREALLLILQNSSRFNGVNMR